MSATNEKLLGKLRTHMEKNPDVKSKELFEVAQGIDPNVSELSAPQFHARYYLTLCRERAAALPPEEKKERKARRAKTAEAKAEQQELAAATSETSNGESQSSRRVQIPTSQREDVRKVFLDFAQEFSQAESRLEIVQVLSKVDEYVDQIAGVN
jgi:hypothetical protein